MTPTHGVPHSDSVQTVAVLMCGHIVRFAKLYHSSVKHAHSLRTRVIEGASKSDCHYLGLLMLKVIIRAKWQGYMIVKVDRHTHSNKQQQQTTTRHPQAHVTHSPYMAGLYLLDTQEVLLYKQGCIILYVVTH